MSYIPGDPRFAPPPGQYMPPPAAQGQRAGSFSGPPTNRYELTPEQQYQYARPQDVPAKYRDDPRSIPEERERERPRKDKRYEDDGYERRDRRQHDEYDDRYDRDRDRDHRDDHRKERDRRDRKEKEYHVDKYGSSPEEVTKKLGKLAVGAMAGAATLGVAQHVMPTNGGKPPASPLLEAYKGTYQSISPMPSALVLSKHKNDSDLSDLDLDSDSGSDIDPRDPNADLKRKIKKLEQEKERHAKEGGKGRSRERERDKIREITPRSSKEDDIHVQTRAPRDRADSDVSTMIIAPGGGKGKKRVTFYDAEDDAKRIAAALEGTHRPPNVKPLIQILPGLSDDDIMALRASYKVSLPSAHAGLKGLAS